MTQATQAQNQQTQNTEAKDPNPKKSDWERMLAGDFVASPAMENILVEGKEFDLCWRLAKSYAQGTFTVPDHFRANEANCFAAVQLARAMGVNPLMLMWKTYLVHNKLGFEAQVGIAAMNASGRYDPLRYEMEGNNPIDMNYRVRVITTHKATKTTVAGPWVDWPMVKAEGWDNKSGSKWKTMPGLMFMYRSAAFFARTNCPELLMGFEMVDELEDQGAPEPKNQRLADAQAAQKIKHNGDVPPAPLPASSFSPPTGAAATRSAPVTDKPSGIGLAAQSAPETGPGAGNAGAGATSAPAPARRGRPPAKNSLQHCKTCAALMVGGVCPSCGPVKGAIATAQTDDEFDPSPESYADLVAAADLYAHWWEMTAKDARDTWEAMAGDRRNALWANLNAEQKARLKAKLETA